MKEDMESVWNTSSSNKLPLSTNPSGEHREISKNSLFNKSFIDMDSLIKRYITVQNRFVREFLSEMFGTTLLVLFGCGSVSQYELRKSINGLNPIKLNINLTFGFGITLAVLITSKISGGHLNPAISFAAFLMGKMSLVRFFIYMAGQFLGAFLGACLVYINYMDSFEVLKQKGVFYTQEYAGIFATYPQDNLSTFGGLVDQTMGTFLLVIVFLTMIDKRNNTQEDGLHWSTVAFVMGIAVSIIGMSFGFNSAYAINPARDFAPRVFTAIAGWGSLVFTAGNYFFWIPIVAPMIGSFIATICYTIFINNTN